MQMESCASVGSSGEKTVLCHTQTQQHPRINAAGGGTYNGEENRNEAKLCNILNLAVALPTGKCSHCTFFPDVPCCV